jgi:CheY-like chemotaxis protein
MTKILIVDDDPMVLESTRLYLENKGYETICATDGNEAIARITESRVHIALVDIFMPNRGGYEIIMSLKDSLPIIAMSGVSSHRFEPLDFAQSLGAAATLSKPFQPSQLLDAIENLLGKRSL